MKRSSIIISSIFGVIVISLLILSYQINNFMNTPMNVDGDDISFEIIKGSSFNSISNQLTEERFITNDFWLRIYVRFFNLEGRIQAGEYGIEPGLTPKILLLKMTSGRVKLYSFTIIEGWNAQETLNALHANRLIKATINEKDWSSFLESLDSKILHPEGLFLPETYRFARNSTDREILKQSYELMKSTLEKEWKDRKLSSHIKNPYDALILASIVEKETARADERAKIAGIFLNRLEKKMRLQTDPTVIYGIGLSFDGNLTRNDLKTDTPYNTYTRHGLPPTPISMPGKASIRAVLDPDMSDFLYFVATGNGDGSHNFSKTKKEHDFAVSEYLSRIKRKKKKESGK